MPAFTLHQVEFSYPRSGPVIAPTTLTLHEGEFVALLGPSGCGKSTLLRLLSGLEIPGAGTLVRDKSAAPNSLNPGALGFVFQESHLLPWRNILENVSLPLELLGKNKEVRESQARICLDRVGLLEAQSLFPHQLSGGMKMRVALARALSTEPQILLLDEPLSALDELTRHRLQEDLRRISVEMKVTTVFVTHSVSEAVFLADRVLLFSARPAKILF